MKEIFSAGDTPANRICYFHLLAFLLLLPFDRYYSEMVLISLVLHTLIYLPAASYKPHAFFLFLPTVLFLLTVLGSLHSGNREQALEDCQKQLALLLFPFIFYFSSLDFEKYKLRLLKAFGAICCLVIIYLFYEAWRAIRFNKLPASAILSQSFTNHNFSLPIDLHATFFSMFIAISLAGYLFLFIRSRNTKARIAYGICCLILCAGLIQLASRSVFLATLIIVNLAVPWFLLKGKTRKTFILFSVIFTLVVVAVLALSGPLKIRFITGMKQDLTNAGVQHSVSDSRMTRWYYMRELILQKPLAGYGSGTEGRLLENIYFEHRLYNSYLHKLKADNQYISLLINFGLLGLLIYISILLIGFRKAILAKDFLFFCFLVIVSLVSFSANILDVNKGIFFFSFFFSYFSYSMSTMGLRAPLAGSSQVAKTSFTVLKGTR